MQDVFPDATHRVANTIEVNNRPPFTSVTLDYAPEAEAAGPQREAMVNPRVLEHMTFPVMSLREAIEAFTEVVYGKRLTFEHE